MARSGVVHSRTGHQRVRPSGRQRWTRSGGTRNSVRAGEGQHLGAFSLGEPAPDAVWLMHLQGVGPTGDHRRTLETHRLGLCFAPGPRGSAFSLRMEEERAGHSAARGVQLPVPQISIRAGKAPGVRHFDPLWSDQISSVPIWPGVGARSVTRFSQQGTPRAVKSGRSLCGVPRWGRIRADPGADVDPTLDRFSPGDKTLILFFVDLGEDPFRGPRIRASPIGSPTGCGIAHTIRGDRFAIGSWPLVHRRLLSAVTIGAEVHLCPDYPLWGPYRRIAEGQGSGDPSSTSIVKKSDASSTSSAGGIT